MDVYDFQDIKARVRLRLIKADSSMVQIKKVPYMNIEHKNLRLVQSGIRFSGSPGEILPTVCGSPVSGSLQSEPSMILPDVPDIPEPETILSARLTQLPQI